MVVPDASGTVDSGLLALADWDNLLHSWRLASRGKRNGAAVAHFEYALGEHLLELQRLLLAQRWRPGPYVHFNIHEPKRRWISATPFADRVVHHALCRPRGLPIGNLTSQFWSNCYLDPLDQFVKRNLRCRAYLRYVDDFALFHDDKRVLREWGDAVQAFLAQRLRLRVHGHSAQVLPCRAGIPWLGFVVYPEHRRVKARKVVAATRRLRERHAAWRRGEISFGEFDATVQGWINHVGQADSWGLRRHVLQGLALEGRCLAK